MSKTDSTLNFSKGGLKNAKDTLILAISIHFQKHRNFCRKNHVQGSFCLAARRFLKIIEVSDN